MTPQLEIDGIQLAFGTRQILSDIHITCTKGKITGLLGRNGQGKTCLMRIIYGDLGAASRSIRFNQVSVTRAYEQPGLLSYLPQFNFIPGSLTLKRIFSDFNLEFGCLEKRFPEFKAAYHNPIRNLSGGQWRLIEIYLIVSSASAFALLDEPFSHLMPLQIEKVKELLLEERENKGFLITDHLYHEIIAIADDLYVLADGKTHRTINLTDIETLGYAPGSH